MTYQHGSETILEITPSRLHVHEAYGLSGGDWGSKGSVSAHTHRGSGSHERWYPGTLTWPTTGMAYRRHFGYTANGLSCQRRVLGSCSRQYDNQAKAPGETP